MEKLLKIPYTVFNNDWNLLQQFLERRGNPRYELIGEVNLSNRKDIIDLGNLVLVDGHLDLEYSSIETIGNLEYVGCFLDISKTPIKSLGNLKMVDGNFLLSKTSIKTLGNLVRVGGGLDLEDTPIQSLGNLNYVGGKIYLNEYHNLPEEDIIKFINKLQFD